MNPTEPPTLRALALSACDASYFFGQAENITGYTDEEQCRAYDKRGEAVSALFAAIDAQEATLQQLQRDATLGANIRAIVENDTLCLSEFRGSYRTMDVLETDGPFTSADTLDEAIAAYLLRWPLTGKDGPQ